MAIDGVAAISAVCRNATAVSSVVPSWSKYKHKSNDTRSVIILSLERLARRALLRRWGNRPGEMVGARGVWKAGRTSQRSRAEKRPTNSFLEMFGTLIWLVPLKERVTDSFRMMTFSFLALSSRSSLRHILCIRKHKSCYRLAIVLATWRWAVYDTAQNPMVGLLAFLIGINASRT